MNTSTRNAVNRPSHGVPSSSNRPTTHFLATRCPFCQAPIALAHGGSATSVCPSCGLRFTVESPRRARGAAPQQAAAPGKPARRAARFVLPAAVLALASAATALLAGWAYLR